MAEIGVLCSSGEASSGKQESGQNNYLACGQMRVWYWEEYESCDVFLLDLTHWPMF